VETGLRQFAESYATVLGSVGENPHASIQAKGW